MFKLPKNCMKLNCIGEVKKATVLIETQLGNFFNLYKISGMGQWNEETFGKGSCQH